MKCNATKNARMKSNLWMTRSKIIYIPAAKMKHQELKSVMHPVHSSKESKHLPDLNSVRNRLKRGLKTSA